MAIYLSVLIGTLMIDKRTALLPRGVTPKQIEDTRTTLQPYYREPLNDDVCLEIILNVYGLFDVFKEIDERVVREAAARKAQSGK